VSRILAVDWGARRVGLAVSDPTGLIARSLPTLEVRSEDLAVNAILETCREEEVERIVVGLPLRLDGSHGDAAESAQRFARRLENKGRLPVEMWDERMTSRQAERQGRELGERTRGKKGRVDARAAALLLQSYLDARGPRTRRETPEPS
jgi:putative Holliday junction resolvase